MRIILDIDETEIRETVEKVLNKSLKRENDNEWYKASLECDNYIKECFNKLISRLSAKTVDFIDLQESTHVTDYRVYTDSMTELYRM